MNPERIRPASTLRIVATTFLRCLLAIVAIVILAAVLFLRFDP